MKMCRVIKRVLAVLITACIVLGTIPYQTVAAGKTTQQKIDDAQDKLEEIRQNVDSAQDKVDDVTTKKKAIQKELKKLNETLESIVGRINDLNDKITAKEAEIKQTEEELATAREIEEAQYEAMKMRIKFMYEESENLYLNAFFQSNSFSNFLTLSNYIESISRYDRNKFNEYQQTRIQIEELDAKLNLEKEELDGLKAEAEEEKAQMQAAIDETSKNLEKHKELLDDAEAELLAYEKELKEQQSTLEALKKQLEEEKRLAALAAKSAWRDISQVHFDEGDRYLLAVLIYCEAGGEPYEGKVAVGAVVMNRVLSSVYPNTVSGVIYQKWQFSPVASGRLAYYMSIGKTNQACYNAADAAMSGVTNVGNCLYFRTPIPGLTGIQIGNHIFY